MDQSPPNLGGDYAHCNIGPYLGQLWSHLTFTSTRRAGFQHFQVEGRTPELVLSYGYELVVRLHYGHYSEEEL